LPRRGYPWRTFIIFVNNPDHMSNTYTQLYIHFVFAVKYRKATIEEEWEDRLQKYITGIVQNRS